MTFRISSLFFLICFTLLFAIIGTAQPSEKSAGIKLFENGNISQAIELLKTSKDLVDLNYLGYAYEKSGNEKEARNAYDRSFRNGYNEFAEELIRRASFDHKQIAHDDALSDFLIKNAGRLVVTAVSSRKIIEMKGPSSKENEWLMRARMMSEIGRLLVSDQMIYSSREIDTDVKVTSKPRPGYTDLARTRNTQGTVELLILLGSDGKVKGAIPTRTLANGLTEQAYMATNKISFTPAQKSGKPVAMLKAMSYSFSIY